jgi:hypothetical protein
MGLCNFICSHGIKYAKISAVLYRLISQEANWLPQNCLEALILLKQSLISEPIVYYSRKHRPHSLIMDAFTGIGDINGGLGAILC